MMRNIHGIKIKEDFIIPIVNGEKTFEIRENDRGYNRGDIIYFIPVNEKGERIVSCLGGTSEITSKYYEITYVLSDFHVDRNYVVFSFREMVE